MENRTKMLLQYARLVAQVGINVQRGQTIVINCPVACVEFGRMLVSASYDAGAKDVIVNWSDDYCAREHWMRADESLFDAVYPWNVLQNDELAKAGAGFISIAASDPENLRGVDPERLRRWDSATGRDQKHFYHLMMSNAIPWCVASVPVASWARKVFPALDEEQAMNRLWDEIFRTVHVTPDGDAVAAWREHCARLDAQAAKLNANHFVSLHYENALGTNLTVGLPEEHVWLGGADTTASGIRFVANMPTEEVFTAPAREAVEGVLVASKPLALNGNIIEGIRMTFKAGRIVDVHADKGEDVLRKAVDTDEGSHYLGEIALVPQDSPIAQSGLLFYNTLFDENAACHFAFGEAYPGCVKGGDGLSIEELKARGINAQSNTHVDFMVGTEDLRITGTTRDGRTISVFENGKFAL